MTTRSNPSPNWGRRLTRVTALNLLASLLLQLLEITFPDHPWPMVLLTNAPPFLFLLPTLLLLLIALFRRCAPATGLSLATAVFTLFALLGFHAHIQSSPAEPTLRVMTFNVEKWSRGVPAIANVIRQFHPDVFCLEEAGDYFYIPGHPPLALQRALPDYHFVRQGEIIIASRYSVTAHSAQPLPPGPESRPALKAIVQTPGGPLTVIAVHLLPSQMDQHLNLSLPTACRRFAQERASQDAALLADAASVPTPLLICGDFNAQPQTASCRRLTRRYPDAFDMAGRGFGYTIPSQAPVMRIDHILLSASLTAHRAWVPNV